MLNRHFWILPGLLRTFLACAPEFDLINEVDDLRIMAIAPDAPELSPGDTTTIRALIRAKPDAGPVTYAWDWCPQEGTAQDRYDCPVSQSDLDDLAQGFGVQAPSLDLGDSPEVEFDYNFATLLELYCGALIGLLEDQDLPDGFTIPSCDERQSITLRLTVSQPDGTQVTAVKRMELLYQAPEDPTTINTSPIIQGVRIAASGVTKEDAVPLEEDTPFPVKYDTDYTMILDVDPDSSQPFTPEPSERNPSPETRQENILGIWYYEAGFFDQPRTAYIYEVSEFESLLTNIWTSPETSDDHAPGIIHIYIVLQDQREGFTWITRSLLLEP